MKKFFSSDFFTSNRKRLREQIKADVPIVITANGQLQKSSDNPYPFHQDPSFWYLTGVNEADVLLVIDQTEEYLILPERSDYQNTFDGTVDTNQLSKISGISKILEGKQRFDKLHQSLKKAKAVATLDTPGEFIEPHAIYTNPARANLIKRLKTAEPKLELVDIRPDLAKLRIIKQPAEIKAIQAAVDITVDSISNITKKLKSYKYEYEIEADLLQGFRKRGASGEAFPSIVASGKRACAMHYFANNGSLMDDKLIVIDVGAEVNHYAADITRTIFYGSKPSKLQQQVYAAVNETQEYGIAQLRPGISFKDCEQRVRDYTGVKLKELGLIKNSKDKEGIAKYYPHAPHYLGLDVHDVGDYTMPLEPGMVLTVEPGIYIPDEGIGVRIEDDILITEHGHEILSHKLPKTLL